MTPTPHAHDAPERLPGVVEQVAEVRGRPVAEWLRLAAEKCCQCTDGHHDQIEYPFGTEDDVRISRDLARQIADVLDFAAGLVQQGTTVEEWGVRCSGQSARSYIYGRMTEADARNEAAECEEGEHELFRRARTTWDIPARVTDWQPVEPTPTHRPAQATTPQEGR